MVAGGGAAGETAQKKQGAGFPAPCLGYYGRAGKLLRRGSRSSRGSRSLLSSRSSRSGRSLLSSRGGRSSRSGRGSLLGRSRSRGGGLSVLLAGNHTGYHEAHQAERDNFVQFHSRSLSLFGVGCYLLPLFARNSRRPTFFLVVHPKGALGSQNTVVMPIDNIAAFQCKEKNC